MFTITPRAAEQVKAAAKQGGSEGLALRFACGTNPDGSYAYKMGFDEPNDDDVMLNLEGLDVAIAPEYMPMLVSTTLDFVELEPGDFQFVFHNPQDPTYVPPQDN